MAFTDFSGCHVPFVTPFKEDFSLDEDGLRRLIHYLIEEEKVDGLVPCGTTGESPTLDHEEHNKVIEITVKETRGRVPVIAGTGSNSTQEAIQMTRHAEAVGADATLQVGPYYNKPTMDGMLAHFEAIARNTKLPILIYNIPGRTGKNIEPQTIIQLAEIDNIVGLKDACADLGQTMEIIAGTKRQGKDLLCPLRGRRPDLRHDGPGGRRRHQRCGQRDRQRIHPDVPSDEGREMGRGAGDSLPDPLPGEDLVHRDQPGPGQRGHADDGAPGRTAAAAPGAPETGQPGEIA